MQHDINSEIKKCFYVMQHAMYCWCCIWDPEKMVLHYKYNNILLNPIKYYAEICFFMGIQKLNIFILKVANIRCFILIAVVIFHNIMRK
jgi:hypothetical protein